MLEKGRISNIQMAIIIIPTIASTAILLAPAISAKYAKQDLWISPIWSSMIGFLIVIIVSRLNNHYPNETPIEYCCHIIGKIPGKLLGFLYLFFFIHQLGVIIQEYGNFIVGSFLHQTPLIVVMAAMVIVCAMAVYGGIEVIGRSSEIIFPVVVLFYFLVLIMLFKDLDTKQLLPIMENGLWPSFRGAFTPTTWFSEFFLLSFLLPYLKDKQKGLKWGLISVLSIALLLITANALIFMLFGPVTEFLTYPFMNAVRYISIAEFLEHLESIVVAIWVAGTFIKITMHFYIIVLGTAQWLNLSVFRPIVIPFGFLLLVMSMWVSPNLFALEYFLVHYGLVYSLIPQFIIPLLLLGIVWMRKIAQKKKRGQDHAPNS